jgi:HSP20 family protein
MAEDPTKMPVKTDEKTAESTSALQAWRPLETLRREVDRLFESFDRDFWRSPFRRTSFDAEPFWQRQLTWAATPAVDIVEKDNAFEVVADMPGFDEKNIEVKVARCALTIKGVKQEEQEERKKGYYVNERRSGSFERTFRLPEGVDTNRIEANFKKGVLTVTLPKKPEAQEAERNIAVKAD